MVVLTDLKPDVDVTITTEDGHSLDGTIVAVEDEQVRVSITNEPGVEAATLADNGSGIHVAFGETESYAETIKLANPSEVLDTSA